MGDVCLRELEQLYRSRGRHFVRVATAILGDVDQAVEAVQDAFADCVRSRKTFRGEGALEAWVWRAVVNAAYRVGRAAVSHAAIPEPAPSSNGYELDEPSELGRLVGVLPERQRLAIFLRYYADLDYRAIAQVLEVEIGTVSATLSAAHKTLRRALEEAPR